MPKSSRPSPRPSRRPSQKISLADAFQLAMTVHRRGQPGLAARHYRAILQVAPGHADALHYLGVAQHQLGQHDDALRLITRALELAPDYVDARNNLGNMQKERCQYAAAEQSYRKVLAARPDFVLAHNNLGVVLKEQGRHAEAIVAYRQAVALAPGFVEAWTNLGHVLKKTGAQEEALSAYREAILLKPDDPTMLHSLGRALVAYGRDADALEVYRRWQEREPDNPVVAHLIAACQGASAPARASDAFVQTTFNRFAESFDQVLARLEYRAPALCAQQVATLVETPARQLDVLDAGCGTGLCGPLLRPYACVLHGVDLAGAMLKKAAQRGDYDALDEAELTAWLTQHPAAYDLIVSADTLCYFGALQEVLAAARQALRDSGLLVFTVEQGTDDGAHPGFHLHGHGRYSHTQQYVRAALATAGLALAALDPVTLRLEAGKPVAGLLVAARRIAP
ncbi:tetratricopeptide repeat protein [Rugamonas apoptosis]|uniref:Tetratricopeptide repeat protein n=1 Tax=Rugamonas apoptosis TaxID=2758570 RepID=A0A7W2IKM1_9BURK|nr:tetratricopeptide repeat protein [Rugamonas apoptosis]MBA5687496.1 tetratricopeptide repeat protein [Rugamonas apoptosis]